MNALFLRNPNVDYLITSGGHYLAYLKKTNRVIFNRFTPGEPHLIGFLKTIHPQWAKIPKKKNPDILETLKLIAKTEFQIEIPNIVETEISSDDRNRFETLVENLT